jgi:RNA polymerase sigma-70 factor (ECF subfamily)
VNTAPPSDGELAQVARAETGRLVASLARWCGDLSVAEEAVAEAMLTATSTWRRTGIPDRPGAWLHTTARRYALDQLRRQQRHREKVALLEARPSDDGERHADDPLRLVFTCCHPSLARPAQLALTLRAVMGLTTAEIARAFLSSEATIAQRITRAKRKIVQAGVPFAVPARDQLADRLDAVLTILYLTYNEGHLATAGERGARRDLAEDAIWFTTELATLLPDEAEVLGLLALLTLSHGRDPARWDEHGRIVVLRDQDRSRYDADAISRGIEMVERAGSMRRPGRFQLQAAIAAVHAEAASYDATDWPQIVALYGLLRRYDDSAVVRLNAAVALSHVAGPGPALADVENLAHQLDGYHLFHAVRAELLRQLERPAEARQADERALSLATNVAEREILGARLADPSAN